MPFHHFIGDGLSRSEKIQLWVVDRLVESHLPAGRRESSVQWELKHSSGVVQIARMLAQKRGIDEELAVVAAALHDIHVIMEGGYGEHAERGADIARKILEGTEHFSQAEIRKICAAVKNHSHKDRFGKDGLSELIKDADCLDCILYGDGIYDDKPPGQLRHYYRRIIRVREELGLPRNKQIENRLKALEGAR
jgi:putative nucleotidyltransferase with HDIG domain